MKVLVTGGNGFLGASLVERLRAGGHAVRVLDPAPPRADMDWNGVDYVRAGLDHPDLAGEVLKGVDLVYHLSSTTVPATSNLDPAADVRGNLLASLRLFEAMGQAGVRRIVFFSSGGTVYGNPDVLPVGEDHPLRPISSYGVVKSAIEQYLGMYRQLGVLQPVILRPSNPYGPRQSAAGAQGVVAAFLARAGEGQGVAIWGDGSTVRDYLYVDDLVTLAVRAGESGEVGVFNAGSGEGVSLDQLCARIRAVTGAALPVDYLPARGIDVRQVVLDIDRARRVFGWQARTTLDEGLSRTWQTMRRAT